MAYLMTTIDIAYHSKIAFRNRTQGHKRPCLIAFDSYASVFESDNPERT